MDPVFLATGIGRQGPRGAGYETLHVAIDDYSRFAYVEVLADAGKHSTSLFLAHTLQVFAALGITVERALTDDAWAYRSHSLPRHRGCGRDRPATHAALRTQANGKAAERFIQTLLREWAYIRPYTSNEARLLTLPTFLDEYNFRRPHSALGHQPPTSRVNVVSENTTPRSRAPEGAGRREVRVTAPKC